jgi:hypothetical protein
MKENKLSVFFPRLFGGFAIAIILVVAGGTAAQTPANPPDGCCWIDIKTLKKVPTAPLAGINTGLSDSPDAGIAIVSPDGKTAYNTRTKQNYALDEDGCWIDIKTLKRVPSVPLAGINTGISDSPDAGIAIVSPDGKTARNTRTGQNYARECPPVAEVIKEYKEETKGSTELGILYDFQYAPAEPASSLHGIKIEIFYNPQPWVGIGGQYGFSTGSSSETIITIPTDFKVERQTFLFGPRFNFFPSDNTKVFFQPLFGGVHDTIEIRTPTASTDFSATAFAMSFGGGVDVRINKRIAFRPFQFEYMPTRFGGSWQNNYRVSTGLVLRFGGN